MSKRWDCFFHIYICCYESFPWRLLQKALCFVETSEHSLEDSSLRSSPGAPHLQVHESTELCSQNHSPLVQGGYALTEEAESVCREQCTGGGFHQKSQLKAANSSLLQPLVFHCASQVQNPSKRWSISFLAQSILAGLHSVCSLQGFPASCFMVNV